ncbi:MAG: tRNA pseudouridine(13) synthase TruD [Candidatus Bathyarchaeota archaeon]|nr:tRNA pseudouridine(13) synthase TruD [Candidatus Bathyarchaeota archaeon]
MAVPEIDKLLGMEVYATKTQGIGGKIRRAAEDFVVEEVLVDGSKASVTGNLPTRVLGSTLTKQRYLLCVLVKRNWDTFIAIKNVAKSLGIDQAKVQFAGIKDAKAVTAQHVTIDNITAQEATKVEVKDVQLQPIGYIHEMLSLFFLLGNNFTISIKDIQLPPQAAQKHIAQTIEELSEVGGMPNFFGHQRFGTTRPITHLVGKALFQGKYEEAAMLFLAKPSDHEHPASRKARQELLETNNFKNALENFPKQLRFERLMLTHLTDHPKDFAGAFRRLPLKLQALFVQAYQSYLFNRFLSERLKHGLSLNEAVAGDFVVGVERSGLPLTSVYKMVVTENLAEINAQVKAGKLRVALPIVGLKQKLSQGMVGRIESEVLEHERLKTRSTYLNELSRGVGKGGLRAALAPVKDFSVKNVSSAPNYSAVWVTVSFMLLRGCYATVVLRELMKPQDPVSAGF